MGPAGFRFFLAKVGDAIVRSNPTMRKILGIAIIIAKETPRDQALSHQPLRAALGCGRHRLFFARAAAAIRPPRTTPAAPTLNQTIAPPGTDLICWAQPSNSPSKPSAAMVIPRPIRASAEMAAVSDRFDVWDAFMQAEIRRPRAESNPRFRDHVLRTATT